MTENNILIIIMVKVPSALFSEKAVGWGRGRVEGTTELNSIVFS